MHHDACAEGFGADGEGVDEGAPEEGGGPVFGVMDEGDGEGGDPESFPGVGTEGDAGEGFVARDDVAHEPAAPAEFLNEGDNEGAAGEAEDEGDFLAEGMIGEEGGIEAVGAVGEAEPLPPGGWGGVGEVPALEEEAGEDPKGDAEGGGEAGEGEVGGLAGSELVVFAPPEKEAGAEDGLDGIPPVFGLLDVPGEGGVFDLEPSGHHREQHERHQWADVGGGGVVAERKERGFHAGAMAVRGVRSGVSESRGL